MMTIARPVLGTPRGSEDFESTHRDAIRIAMLAATLVLAGCAMPSLGGLWGDDEEEAGDPAVARAESTEAADDVPGEAGAYPNLATVPDRSAVRRLSKEARAKLAEGLFADRENARYTDQIVRRDGAFATTSRPAPRPPAVAGAAPRTTALLGAPAKSSEPAKNGKPAKTAATTSQPSESVSRVKDKSGAGPSPSGRVSRAQPPSAPAIPVAPVSVKEIVPPPAAVSAATLIGKPAILPPPLPPSRPTAPANEASRSAATTAKPVGALAAPPPPAMLAVSVPPPPPPPPPPPAGAAPTRPRTVATAPAPMPPARAAVQTLAPAPPANGAYRPTLAGQSDQVGTILFAHGATRLARQDKRLLRQIALLHRTRGGSIRIVGHSSGRTKEIDAVRHQMVNFEISLKRANAVADELRHLGVPAQRIVVEAKSNSEPKFFESMPSGEAGNRRADVFFDY